MGLSSVKKIEPALTTLRRLPYIIASHDHYVIAGFDTVISFAKSAFQQYIFFMHFQSIWGSFSISIKSFARHWQ